MLLPVKNISVLPFVVVHGIDLRPSLLDHIINQKYVSLRV